ncbi:hypothetical protein [Shinella zoogloeoides]|uniref:hypothetical protein n=1 Tax=Shinella zoogloeoides TaxID=352475 RepID=UPI001F55ADDA|nr:hypothetical protein [Shinella zoogloeoides]
MVEDLQADKVCCNGMSLAQRASPRKALSGFRRNHCVLFPTRWKGWRQSHLNRYDFMKATCGTFRRSVGPAHTHPHPPQDFQLPPNTRRHRPAQSESLASHQTEDNENHPPKRFQQKMRKQR